MMDLDATRLEEIERRQPKYWSMDGLPQLMTGVGWLLWGSLYLIGLALLDGRSYLVYWLTITSILVPWGIAVPWALGQVKERTTHPRVGYARAPITGSAAAASVVCALGAVLWGLKVFDFRIDFHGFDPFLVGGSIALAIAAPTMRSASKRIMGWWCVLLTLQLATYLRPRARTANDAALYWTLVCMGVVGIVFGAVRLRRFLRENTKPAETET